MYIASALHSSRSTFAESLAQIWFAGLGIANRDHSSIDTTTSFQPFFIISRKIPPHPLKIVSLHAANVHKNHRLCDSRQRPQQLQCWSYHVVLDGLAICQELWCLSSVGRSVSSTKAFVDIVDTTTSKYHVGETFVVLNPTASMLDGARLHYYLLHVRIYISNTYHTSCYQGNLSYKAEAQ